MAAKPLRLLIEKSRRFLTQMREVKQQQAALMAVCQLHLMVKLVGTNSSSRGSTLSLDTRTIGELREDEKELIAAIGTSPVASFNARAATNMLHSYSRDYIKGADLALKRGDEFLRNFPATPICMWDHFHMCMCLSVAAKETGKRKYRRQEQKLRKTIERWIKSGNSNVGHHVVLLEAEQLAAQKKQKDAGKAYVRAINSAARGGFLQDVALANERYAVFLLNDVADFTSADFYMEEAIRLYREWGADALADSLQETGVSKAKIDISEEIPIP